MPYRDRTDLAQRLGVAEQYLPPDLGELIAPEPGKPTISRAELTRLCQRLGLNFRAASTGFHLTE